VSKAETRRDLLKYCAAHYKDQFIRAFEYAMDGEAVEMGKETRKYFTAQNIGYWLQLKAKDRASGALPGQGEADAQLRQWVAGQIQKASP
jgi:hypothetical protein